MSSFRDLWRTAVQMRMLRESRAWLFSVSEAPDVVSRVHVDSRCNGPLVAVWMTSVYSTAQKHGLHRGLRTPEVFGLGKGV